VSIGTLVAFSMVAIGVMVLRRTMPDLHRPFKVPLFPILPILTVAACVYVLSGLAAITWVIFAVWLSIVLAYYFLVGRHRSRLNDPQIEVDVR
jgi:amino acid transporter